MQSLEEFFKISSNVASKLFYSYCCSFYGCQLWDLSSNSIEDIYVAWQKAIRRIFNLPCNTHRYLLPFVAGSSHIRVNLVNRFNNFFNALMSCDNKIIELLVYNCHFSNTPLAGCPAVREKSGKFQTCQKSGKSQGILLKVREKMNIGKSQGKVREFAFSAI